MDTLLSSVLLAAITHNLALDGLLGLCPLLAVSRRHEVALGMAVVTLVVLPPFCVLGYLTSIWALRPLGAESLALVIWALLFSAAALAGERWLRRIRPTLHHRYGVYMPLLGVNCLVLGAVLLTTTRAGSLLQVIAYAIGTAMGFALVLLVLGGLRERLMMVPLPAAMRGAPSVFVTLGLLALALLGLRGVG